jgi:hypothetical protein
MTINYYGKPQLTTDQRFNTKQTQVGSDPRINRKTKKQKYFTIKFKYIVYTVIAIILLFNCVSIEVGLISPQNALESSVTKVEAKVEQVPVVEKPVQNKPVSNNEIESKLRKVFGPDADNAIKLVSQCENRAMNPSQIGDDYPINGKHIVSVGVFQIRALPGRPSIEELKNPDVNIAEAYKIFKRDGRFGATSGWYNCSKLLNIK